MEKLKFRKNVFKNIDTEEEAYWLGFILADGCNIGNKNLRVDIKDKGHLEKLSKLIYIDEKPISITDHGFGPIYYFSCTKKEIISNLNSYGVVPRKSKIAKLPIIKEHLYRHFIRGLFDGDGSICYTMDKNYRRYQFSIVGTEELMKKVYDIFLKETSIVLGYGKMKMIYRVYKKGNQQIMSILNWLYKDASVYLERKHDKYEDMLNYYILKTNTYSKNVLIEKTNISK